MRRGPQHGPPGPAARLADARVCLGRAGVPAGQGPRARPVQRLRPPGAAHHGLRAALAGPAQRRRGLRELRRHRHRRRPRRDLPGAARPARPGRELVWSVADAALPVPDGTGPSCRAPRAWFEALGRRRFAGHQRRPSRRGSSKAAGQVLVQTWRGQPVLRRLGTDVNDPRVLDEDDDVLVREQAGVGPAGVARASFATARDHQALGFRGRRARGGLAPQRRAAVRRGRVRSGGRHAVGWGCATARGSVLYAADAGREYARARGHHEKVPGASTRPR